jgi:hypothetical protein
MTGHSLAVGESLTNKYGSWGIANQRMIKPPSRLFGLAFGPPNAGKTSLFSWNPGALIINCDGSSTPLPFPGAPAPTAQFFPGFNAKGESIGPTGSVMNLTWEKIDEMRLKLIEAAEKNLPRPEIVVLDSVTTAMHRIKEHLVIKDRAKPNRSHVKEWSDLHGEAAWEALYNTLLNFAHTLLPHYGVWFIAHITDKWKSVGGADVKVRELTVPDGFRARFNPLLELAICLEARLSPEKVTTYIDVPGTGKVPQIDTIMKKKAFLTGETADLANVYKQRIALPVNLELPPTKEWETFCKAYESAAAIPV